jgi:hypothetical protein
MPPTSFCTVFFGPHGGPRHREKGVGDDDMTHRTQTIRGPAALVCGLIVLVGLVCATPVQVSNGCIELREDAPPRSPSWTTHYRMWRSNLAWPYLTLQNTQWSTGGELYWGLFPTHSRLRFVMLGVYVLIGTGASCAVLTLLRRVRQTQLSVLSGCIRKRGK